MLSIARIAAVCGISLLLGTGALTLSANAVTPTTVTSPTQARVERHPELRAALRALKTAQQELKSGAHDFGGERVEALKDTDKAIAEVEQALKKDAR